MSEVAAYPSIITNKLFQVEARKVTYLTNDITSGQTSFAADTAGFPDEGFITIENETIYYPSLTALQFGGVCVRGYAGTAVSHLAGAMIRLSVAAVTTNRIISEIIAIQTYGGTSGGAAGYINARYLGGSTEGQLNLATTQTLTNKRITKREVTIASSATPTPNSDITDIYTITALAEAATFGAPTGTPTQGQTLLIRIKDNGTARALSWNAIYRAGTDVALPTTTVLSKTLYVGFIYNSTDTKFDLIFVDDGF